VNSFNNKSKTAAAFVCSIALILVSGCTSSPPIQEMSDARQAIAAAKEAGAEQHAAETLDHAELMLDTAENYLERGVYWQAKSDAISAKDKAFEALLTSREATTGQSNPAAGAPQ
jgi:hypothetical protein